MEATENLYIYERRFKKHSLKQKGKRLSNQLKRRVLNFIAESRLKEKLNPVDYYSIRHEKREINNFGSARFKYDKFELSRMKLFEVIEIDDFDRHKATMLRKFKDKSPLKREGDLEKLSSDLDEIKGSLNSTIRGGKIGSWKCNNMPANDLIERVDVGYSKTMESYFILTIEIIPSQKFKKIFKTIIESDDYSINTINFNKAGAILMRRTFVRDVSVNMNSISYSLNNLIADLNHQVKVNITNHVKGIFYKEALMPRIEHYEVDSIEEFRKDEVLTWLFSSFRTSFSLAEDKVNVFPNTQNDLNDFRMRTLKEKGYKIKENSKGDLTDYDWAETHYLLRSLEISCAVDAVLKTQYKAVTGLKRKVYDYISKCSQKNIFDRFLFFKSSREYVNLKVNLSKSILTFTRFEDEFSNNNLRYLFRDMDLSMFKFKGDARWKDIEASDLHAYFQNKFSYQISHLNRKINTLEQVFKPIEDLSVYRTNFWLQVFSLVTGLLALILTFDKIKDFVVAIYEWVASRLL